MYSRDDLERLASQRTKIRNHEALCVFHRERTPSLKFSAHPRSGKGTYKCFGCGSQGDAEDWLVKVEGYSPADARQRVGREIGDPAPAPAAAAPPRPAPRRDRAAAAAPDGDPAPLGRPEPSRTALDKHGGRAPDHAYDWSSPDYPAGVKQFRWDARDGRPKDLRWQYRADPRRLLYLARSTGWPLLPGAVIVAEGAKDALHLAAAGWDAAGLPAAGSLPYRHVVDWLLDADPERTPLRAPVQRVILWPDADEPGARLMESLAALIRAARPEIRVEWIDPPLGAGKGDGAADVARDGLGDVIEGAREWTPAPPRQQQPPRRGPADTPPPEAYDESEAPAPPAPGGAGKRKRKAGPGSSDDADAAPPLEYALGQQFVARAGGRLLYAIDLDRWIEFGPEGNWSRQTRGAARRRVREFLRGQCPDPAPRIVRRWESNALAKAVHEVACDEAEADTGSQFDGRPELIGIAPAPGRAPALRCDLSDGSASAMTAEHRIMRRTGAPLPEGYDVRRLPAHPRMDAYLERTFGGDRPTIQYLWRYLGYALTGATDEHKLLYLQGPGATGKSVLLRILRLVYGDYARAVSARAFLRQRNEEHPTIRYKLMGPHLILVPETPSNAVWDDEFVNGYIGGDDQDARRMREDYVEFRPRGKLVIASNFRLRLADPESGLLRRIVVIRFAREVPPAERVPGLADQIYRAEGDAILARIVCEAAAWRAKLRRTDSTGLLDPSESIRRETREYLAESDTLGLFVAACLGTGDPERHSVTSSELYAAYTAWAEAEGLAHRLSRNWLVRKLRNRLEPRGVRTAHTRTGGRVDGLYLRSEHDQDDRDDGAGTEPGAGTEAPF